MFFEIAVTIPVQKLIDSSDHLARAIAEFQFRVTGILQIYLFRITPHHLFHRNLFILFGILGLEACADVIKHMLQPILIKLEHTE